MLEWKYQLPASIRLRNLSSQIPSSNVSKVLHNYFSGYTLLLCRFCLLQIHHSICCHFHQPFSLPWKQQFFFVTQCKQIDICKFPYSVMQTLPVVFSTEVRYFMGGSGTLIADVHLSCSTTLEAQLRSSADFAW